MSKALVFCSAENCLHSFDFKMNSALEKCLQIGLVKWCQAAGFLAGPASEAQDPTEPYICCSVFWDQPLKIHVNLSLNLCSVVGEEKMEHVLEHQLSLLTLLAWIFGCLLSCPLGPQSFQPLIPTDGKASP